MNPISEIEGWIESTKEHPKYIEFLDFLKESGIIITEQDEKVCRFSWSMGYFAAIEELNTSIL